MKSISLNSSANIFGFKNFHYEKTTSEKSMRDAWERIAPGEWLILNRSRECLDALKILLSSLNYNLYLDVESYDKKICGIRKRGNFLIPKIIHAVWVGNKELPEHSASYLNSWAEKHNYWERWIWSDQALNIEGWQTRDIGELDMSLGDLYLNLKLGVRKSNVARLEIIKKYGGVYIDCDIVCQKNIEYLIDGVDSFAHKYFGHKYGKFEESINNAFFGATRENRFVDLNLYLINNQKSDYKNLDNRPFGPTTMTNVKKIHDVYSFEPWVASPYNWLQKEKSSLQYPEAFCLHKWDKNW